MGVHKTYKNKCESPKAATTEGTINCYMEADACVESLLQIIAFISFRLSSPSLSWSSRSIIAKMYAIRRKFIKWQKYELETKLFKKQFVIEYVNKFYKKDK